MANALTNDSLQQKMDKLLTAVVNNDQQIFDALLANDSLQQKTNMLFTTIVNNDQQMFDALLPVADPKLNSSNAIRLAAYYQRWDMVEKLIPISDCKINNSAVLVWAAYHNSRQGFNLLFPHTNLAAAIEILDNPFYDMELDGKDPVDVQDTLRTMESTRQKELLEKSLVGKTAKSAPKKM